MLIITKNGLLIDADHSLSSLDRGFLFGHAIFETLLVVEGHLVGWPFHYERLKESAQLCLISLPSEIQILEYMKKTLKYCENTGRYRLRLTFSGGEGLSFGNITQEEATCLIYLLPVYEEAWHLALKLMSVPDDRGDFLVKVKSNNYIYNMISYVKAQKNGFHDALFLRGHYWTEATTASLVWRKKGVFLTTDPALGCLPGTTLRIWEKALQEKGMILKYDFLGPDTLEEVEAVFILSSTRGLVLVEQIDEKRIPLSFSAEEINQYNALLMEYQKRM